MGDQISRRGIVSSALGVAASLAVGSRQERQVAAAEPGASAAEPATNPPRKFRLGLVTYNFAPQWDLKTLLKRCKAAGYEGIEPRTTHKHGVEPTLSKEQRSDVRKQFADPGIVLWCLGTVCEFHSPEPGVAQKNVDDCKRWTELAHDLGAQCVKVRPNGLPKEVEEAKTLEQIGRSLHACAEAGDGIEIVCEVHGYDTAEPRRMRRIMDVADHPRVGVTWNSNGTDVKNGSVKGSFELLKPFVKSCHMNDLLSGYPYRELFTLLRQAGYDRWTEMEFNPPLESTSDRDNVLFMKYYKGVWNELSKA